MAPETTARAMAAIEPGLAMPMALLLPEAAPEELLPPLASALLPVADPVALAEPVVGVVSAPTVDVSDMPVVDVPMGFVLLSLVSMYASLKGLLRH